ncbi:MAG: dephospho-CoA kinase [Clostridia bacterium]|nr:dephospho-CoA kinase [Clostridia bacterium]
MVKIGLCGSSGAGKGYVCEIFKEFGAQYIDTDKVYGKIAVAGSDCVNELCMFFGDGILNEDGSLNKKKLSAKVFESSNASQHLKVLNTVTHKYIRETVERMLEKFDKKGERAVVIDAPVLFESGFNDMCDVTMCITAPKELKIERIMKRDRITYKKALARIESQLTDEVLRSLCTYEVVNDGTKDLKEQISAVLTELGVV